MLESRMVLQVLPDAHWTYAVLLHAKPCWTWPLLQDPLQEGHLPAQSPSSTPPADLASSANNAAHIRDGSRAQRGALPPESPSGPRAKRPAECSQRSESPMRGSDGHAIARADGSGHFVLSRRQAVQPGPTRLDQPPAQGTSANRSMCSSCQIDSPAPPSAMGGLADSTPASTSRAAPSAADTAGPDPPDSTSAQQAAAHEAAGDNGPDQPGSTASKLLFSGFVSFSQLHQQHVQTQSSRPAPRFRSGFRANASLAFAWRPPLLDPTAGVDSGDPQPTRVKMTGPGGDGFAEVAVTWLPRSDPLDPSHHPSMDGSEPVDGTHLRAPDAADQRQGAKQAPPSDALKPAEFTSLHQTPAADRYSSHGPLHIRQKAVDGWEKQDPGHVAGKHSSVSSSSSGWVPVEGGSTGSSSGAEDDLGSWRSRLWSHVASRLPPSMTGAPFSNLSLIALMDMQSMQSCPERSCLRGFSAYRLSDPADCNAHLVQRVAMYQSTLLLIMQCQNIICP